MQMVPPRLDPQKSSDAEQQVFDLLSTLEVPGWTYCFHSVNLPVHQYKRACEIDFLLLGKRGLLVLEVKGGTVTCNEGLWTTTTKGGLTREVQESPFKQAEGARIQLERQLRSQLGTELVRSTVIGHGVVIPEVDFEVESVEWAPEMVIDRQTLAARGLQDALNRLGAFWEDKDESRRALSKEEVDLLKRSIRPSFDLVPGIRQTSGKVEKELRILTERQYSVLDEQAHNPRVIIEGGAGTGKTLLASEFCRRTKAAGSRAVVTCRSIVLTAFLRNQDDLEQGDVVQFDRLADLEQDSVDVLIVDEAQDLINDDDLRQMDRVLNGGLYDGRWVMLLDSNNQMGLVGRYEEPAMKRLTDEIRAARVHLLDNCRNTTEIVEATRVRTQADLGTTTAGHGEPVRFIDGTHLQVVAETELLLSDLEAAEALHDILLLSPFDFRDSVFNSLTTAWRRRIHRLDLMRPRRSSPGLIGFAKTADFKGLERRHVLLEEPKSFDAEHARRLLYVGMTRARAGLWVISTNPTERNSS
jgi:hypothetical protein